MGIFIEDKINTLNDIKNQVENSYCSFNKNVIALEYKKELQKFKCNVQVTMYENKTSKIPINNMSLNFLIDDTKTLQQNIYDAIKSNFLNCVDDL